MDEILHLSEQILSVHQYFRQQALKQINNALTLRNWMIGHYIVEFEQQGKGRAEYGEKTLKLLSEKLSETGNKGFSDRNLRLFRRFYLEYPAIWQLLTTKFQSVENKPGVIWQSLTAKFNTEVKQRDENTDTVPVSLLLDKLSFTHIIELLRVDDPLKRTFYEIQAIQNNWTVDMLKRNINSLSSHFEMSCSD